MKKAMSSYQQRGRGESKGNLLGSYFLAGGGGGERVDPQERLLIPSNEKAISLNRGERDIPSPKKGCLVIGRAFSVVIIMPF